MPPHLRWVLPSLLLPAALGAGWTVTRADDLPPGRVPLRGPLPPRITFTDGSRAWTLKAEKIGLDPESRRLDLKQAAAAVHAVAVQADHPGKDARLVLLGYGAFSVTQSEMARAVDREATLRNLIDFTTAANPKLPLRLVVEKRPPRVATEDLEKIDGPVAGFITRYNPGDRPRTQNVRLVAKRLNGAVILKGAVFSFNGHVGPRKASAGFRVAHVFANGRMINDVGGGTCQVSSTLYNAALLAGLKIEERGNHSFTVPYVTPGRDAMVYWGQQDFKFRNTTTAPIYIHATATGGRMRVTLYGARVRGPKIEIVSWSRRRGSRVFGGATRLYKQDGRVVKRERLSSDVYKPLELAPQG